MDTCGNVPEKRTSDTLVPQKQIYSVASPQDTERCRGCTYPGVGFICWSTADGSCLKTDVEKISRKTRR